MIALMVQMRVRTPSKNAAKKTEKDGTIKIQPAAKCSKSATFLKIKGI